MISGEEGESQSLAGPARVPSARGEESAPTQAGQGWDQVLVGLRRIERRECWLWATAIVVMLLLTLPVISFAWAPVEDPLLQFSLGLSARGLLGVVLLFCLYVIYTQMVIKRLRRERAADLFRASQLEVHAERLYELAVMDPLTGLYNRRFAEPRIREECKRADRHGTSLTAVMLDLDDFKEINDSYGHAAGDLALKEFAGRLKSVSRGSDIAVRLGGDEFMLVLPDCLSDQVHYLIDRLRQAHFELPTGPIALSFSAGWSQYKSGESADHLLERADQALYSSKVSTAKRT